jgi:hypothetical protein
VHTPQNNIRILILAVSCYCYVTVADASEPGKGEHKVMKSVRHLRAKPGYDTSLLTAAVLCPVAAS